MKAAFRGQNIDDGKTGYGAAAVLAKVVVPMVEMVEVLMRRTDRWKKSLFVAISLLL